MTAPLPPVQAFDRAPVVLVGGGVRCGKSAFALARAAAFGPQRTFIATAQAFDDEMHQRIAAHQAERAGTFSTVEAPTLVAEALLEVTDAAVVVVDCLTLWLSNLLMQEHPDAEISQRFDALVAVLGQRLRPTILVTNEVGLGVVPPSPLGRRFRDLSGRLHQRLMVVADEVYFGALGAMLRLRPNPVCLVTTKDLETP